MNEWDDWTEDMNSDKTASVADVTVTDVTGVTVTGGNNEVELQLHWLH